MEDVGKKILELGEKYRNYTAELLSEQTKIKGLSLQEKDIANCIKNQMIKAGFDEVRIDGLGNVIGRIGKGKKSLCFDGHIDTVDVGNLSNWSFDPFSGEIKDGFVHGRGTADQRGGVAAFIAAGRILKEMGFDKDLSIYFVGSVIEEDCDGLCWKYIIEEEKLKPDYVVSTESTECTIYRGHRGRMEINVDFTGISCHGSAPHRGVNAIYMASKFALEIEKLNEKLKKDEFLGKGTVAVTEMVTGSPSLCAVSDYAKIHLDRRLTWGETKESAVAEIQKIIKDLGMEGKKDSPVKAKVWILKYEEVSYTGKKYGMEKYFPTWKIPEKHEAVQEALKAYETLWKKKCPISRWVFSTNCIAINGMHGIPCIGFGPGKEEMAHAPDEKTPVDDLVRCSQFYAMYAYYIASLEK